MSWSWVCALYVLLLVSIAAAKTAPGRKFFRLALEFAVLPALAAILVLALLGIVFGL